MHTRMDAHTSRLVELAAALVPLACSGDGEARGPAVVHDPPAIERFVGPSEEPRPAARVCGWLTLPSGRSAYYPCAAPTPRSPVSDPPMNDHDLGGPSDRAPAPGEPAPADPR